MRCLNAAMPLIRQFNWALRRMSQPQHFQQFLQQRCSSHPETLTFWQPGPAKEQGFGWLLGEGGGAGGGGGRGGEDCVCVMSGEGAITRAVIPLTPQKPRTDLVMPGGMMTFSPAAR